MSYHTYPGDDQQEEEHNEEDEAQEIKKEMIIFLIDASPAMQKVMLQNKMALSIALEMVSLSMRREIHQNPKIGAVTKSEGNFDHVYALYDIDEPDVERIINLENIVKTNDFSGFGHFDGEFPLANAFWECQYMFDATPGSKNAAKTVHLMTCRDNPCAGNDSYKTQAIKRAIDMQTDIVLEMHAFPTVSGAPFDRTLFYDSILNEIDEEGQPQSHFEAYTLYEEIKDEFVKRTVSKRSTASLKMTLANGLDIGAKVYNLIIPAPKKSPVWVTKSTSKPVKVQTNWLDASSGKALAPEEIRRSHEYGSQMIPFSVEEVQKVKDFGEPSLKILCFKHMDTLKVYENITHPQFLYPDEDSVTGSTVSFASLLNVLLSTGKYAVARYVARKNATVRLVALIPQREITEESSMTVAEKKVLGHELTQSITQSLRTTDMSSHKSKHKPRQIMPPGFHIVPLPFSDDIRTVHVPQSPNVSDEQIEACTNMIKKTSIKLGAYDPAAYPNPMLQHVYSAIEARALKNAQPETFEDSTLPRQYGGNTAVINDANKALFPREYDPDSGMAKTRKREATGAGSRARARAETTAMTDADWSVVGKDRDRLRKLKVDDLKKQGYALGFSGISKLKKDELIDKLFDHYSTTQ